VTGKLQTPKFKLQGNSKLPNFKIGITEGNQENEEEVQ
jgi:hypothetical protein